MEVPKNNSGFGRRPAICSTGYQIITNVPDRNPELSPVSRHHCACSVCCVSSSCHLRHPAKKMRLESFDILSVCMLCFVTPVQGQSSSTTSITAGSATRTTISGSTTTGTSSITENSSSTTIRTTNSRSSGSVSASSTLSAELPSLSGYSTCGASAIVIPSLNN